MSGTSSTYAFNPPLSELAIDAFERCGKLGVELTQQSQMLASARRSFNLLLSAWANKGVNLWTVDTVAQPMPQGVYQYFDDRSCIDVLADSVVVRQYPMGAPVNVGPAVTTIAGATTATVYGFNPTPVAGGYVNVVVPISVGGIIVQGFYQVQSVPSTGAAVVNVSPAASSWSMSGVTPEFDTLAGSTSVTVTFPDHGLLDGETFNVQVPTTVGGVTLSGPYIVSGTTTNTFFITVPFAAGTTAGQQENGGLAQLVSQPIVVGQPNTAQPTDIRMYPLSRTDYISIPQKFQQGRPNSYWLDRQVVPVFNVWLVPDGNGPWELRYKRSRYIQDADFISGQQLQVPQRFLEAFVSGLAAHLAMKFAPERAVPLKAYADVEWQMAAGEDEEKVTTYFTPDLSSYFNA